MKTEARQEKKKALGRHKLVGPKEVAELMDVTTATVINWCNKDEIPGTNVGAIYRFHLPTVAKQLGIPDEAIEAYYAARS